MHRDLKPAHVMLVGQRLCIMDFGLARVFEGEGSDANYTQTGAVIGTPGYMASEQLMGDQATPGSDIYAMGLLVFEMLTGRKASMTDSLTVGKTGLPAKWEQMILRCVAKDAALRPKTGAAPLELLDGVRRKASFRWEWLAVAALVVVGVAL